VSATLDGLTGIEGIAPLVAVGTLALAVQRRLTPQLPGMSAAYAMAAAGVIFFGVTGIGRVVNGVDYATESRYLYVGVVLFLPLLGAVLAHVVADRRWLPLVAGFALWALLANVSALYVSVTAHAALSQEFKRVILLIAADSYPEAGDPDLPIAVPGAMTYVTPRLVRELRDKGELPAR
jgi:hypothetical protein